MSKDASVTAFPSLQTTSFDVTCDKCKNVVRFHDINHPGMSLRDYFAAAMLSGVMDNYASPQDLADSERDRICKWCYYTADAMILERNKP